MKFSRNQACSGHTAETESIFGEGEKAETAARGQRNIRSEYPPTCRCSWLYWPSSALTQPHTGLQSCTHRVFFSRETLSSWGRLQTAIQPAPHRVVVLPSQEQGIRDGQSAMLQQQKPGNSDFLRCMNGGFVQPSPACLGEVRAACWLCHGSEQQPGAL